MPGESDLTRLLAGMDPELRDGVYVFATVAPGAAVDGVAPVATVHEREGRTLVLRREEAERAGLDGAFPCAWITLRVHSDLEAVGFTARIATVLAEAGISCNVIAAFHHDHLFVQHERGREAVALLREVSERARGG